MTDMTDDIEDDDDYVESGWRPTDQAHKLPMPQELRDAWETLRDDLIRLHFVWQDFSTLFRDKENRAVMGEAAGGFFTLAGYVYWQFVVIELYKLIDTADGPKMKGGEAKKNLTFARFLAQGYIDDANLKQAVEGLLVKCRAELATLAVHRKQRIAHNDLPTRLGIEKLDPITYDTIDRALDYSRQIMDAISRHYDDLTVGYDRRSDANDANLLVARLRDGLLWSKQERREWLRAHGIAEEDAEKGAG